MSVLLSVVGAKVVVEDSVVVGGSVDIVVVGGSVGIVVGGVSSA